MDHDMWIVMFAATLLRLRPDITGDAVHQIAKRAYDADDIDPAAAARAYHDARQQPPAPAPAGD
jgi:hypothetical protein